MSLFDDPPPPRRTRPEPPPPPVALTVSQLTQRIDQALKAFGRVAVEGEVSRPNHHSSGHVYFTLKDAGALLDCKIWRSQVPRALRGRLSEGQHIVAHGTLDVYAPQGRHALVVDLVEEKGLGALLAELERLKARLAAEGLFGRKRPLPRLPRKIGVVTSRDADAWRDFLRTRTLRWPGFPVVLAHSRVQGRGAADELAAAIARLDRHGVDVIVVCRGGGALEDLWCFNEEPVARAIFAARVPVVTGVGHETDTTLVDLVADHRAHTPTDAAQTVIPARADLVAAMERQAAYLTEALERHLERRTERLTRLERARVLTHPAALFALAARRVDEAGRRLGSAANAAAAKRAQRLEQTAVRLSREAPNLRLERAARALDVMERRLTGALQRSMEQRSGKLAPLERALGAISPLAVLQRGYSITRREDGRVVRAASELEPGETVETLLGRGSVRATVVARTESEEPR